ncbi:hypothetical protein [Aureispira anguillae]|uniref:Lipoprotein n=1 Tax=Aureispira anguillae TaxID=2864201 RepID=A0A915YC15_9BACT|nr:hypothetical protein [Aureispira anguillae]BDS10291.1 hypothetical protein AsAng_0009990 [Aureispira anguillae]
MTKYLFILLAGTILFASCGKGKTKTTTDKVDSTATHIDTLVSDVNWGEEEFYVEEEEPPKKQRRHSHSSGGGGGGGAADNDADVIKYQNYIREGDRPKDFAKALIYPAIRMVYSDNFAKPSVSVLSATQDGDRHNIDLQITWKDRWTPKYEIKGTLLVNSDGSDAIFTITDKNVEAEVLELTEDFFQSEISLPSL